MQRRVYLTSLSARAARKRRVHTFAVGDPLYSWYMAAGACDGAFDPLYSWYSASDHARKGSFLSRPAQHAAPE